jgi:hypothetical protein
MATCLALVGVSASAFAASAGATTAPIGAGVCGATKVRPPYITLATDGDSFLAGYKAPGHVPYAKAGASIPGFHWTQWTASFAEGDGYRWIDNDSPSVGGGTDYAFTATVHLSRPEHGVFTRMTISARSFLDFDLKWHVGYDAHQTLVATPCSSGGYGWS